MQIKKLRNIKSYSSFINENKESQTNIKNYKNNWYLNENDIKFLFEDLLVEGWNIDINYIFKSEEFNKISDYAYEWIKDKILLDEDVIPAYYLTIIPKYKSDKIDNDIIGSLKNSIRALLYEVGSDEKKDLAFVVKDYYYSHYLDAIDSLTITKNDSFDILIAQDNFINIDESFFQQYYDLEVNSIFEDENTDDKLIVYREYDDMVSLRIKNTIFEKILMEGTDYLSTEYPINNYIPQNIIDLMHNLNKENEKLLVETIINDLGGYKEVNEILKTNYKSNNEATNSILNERFYNMLDNISEDSTIIDYVKNIIAGAFKAAHVNKNYEELEDEFLQRTSEEYDFVIVEKDGEKYFKISYDNKWISGMDYNDISYFETLDDIFYEYDSNLNRIELNPSFSEYAMPTNDYNKEITEYLKSLNS